LLCFSDKQTTGKKKKDAERNTHKQVAHQRSKRKQQHMNKCVKKQRTKSQSSNSTWTVHLYDILYYDMFRDYINT